MKTEWEKDMAIAKNKALIEKYKEIDAKKDQLIAEKDYQIYLYEQALAHQDKRIAELERKYAHADQMADYAGFYKAENEQLKKRITELESVTYCAYCGKEYPVDGDASDIGEHIQTCERHPLFKANKRIAELEAILPVFLGAKGLGDG